MYLNVSKCIEGKLLSLSEGKLYSSEGGPCTGTKYSVLQCSTTAPAPPKAKSGACFSFETTTEASHNYGKVGVSVSWILLALISFNRPILGRYLDGRLRRTAPMSTLTSPSNTHMLIRHRPDMCCMPAQPCAVPQMLSCIIRRVQYSCTTFSTALYSTSLSHLFVCDFLCSHCLL